MTINNSSAQSRPDALAMTGASLDFGGGAGVFDLTFSLPKGAILGMIGPSGCGKTTTIRLLNGIYTPTAGDVHVFDRPPARFAGREKERLGYIPQQFILYPNLSVEENLHFLGGLYGMSRHQRVARIPGLLEFVELTTARHRLGRQLSGGIILTGLLALLRVPLPAAHPLQHVALIVLLATASVGIGLLISSLSHTDSQAIQFVMLLLLLSIFFTGFFLPITGFAWPAWIIALLVPMTHALQGFQALLLEGKDVPADIWWALAIIAVLAYGLVGLVMRRKYRRTTG